MIITITLEELKELAKKQLLAGGLKVTDIVIEKTFKKETIIPENADFIKAIKSKLSEEPRVSMFTRGEYKNLTVTSVRETDKLIQKYNGVYWTIDTRQSNAKHLINLD